jgi:tetratricopeptide (TPR) repeat protein
VQSRRALLGPNLKHATVVCAKYATVVCAVALFSWAGSTIPVQARTFSTYEQALEDLDEEHYDAAQVKLKNVIEQNPRDADAHADLARAYMNQDNCEQTMAECTQAIQLDPQIYRAYADRAYCFFKLGRIRQGFEDSEKAITLYTVNPLDGAIGTTYKNRGKAFKMIGKTKESSTDQAKAQIYEGLREATKEREKGLLNPTIDKIDALIKLDPQNADLWFFRGIISSNQNKHWQAVADFSRALKLAPRSFAMLKYFRGDSYQQLGRHQQAVDDFTAVINANPRIVAYRFVCETGRLRNELMRDDTSVISVGDVYFLRAQSYTALKKLTLAIQDLEAAGRLNKSDDKAFAQKAELVMGTGKFDQAIKDYTKSVAANPNDWTRYKERADAYLQLGKNNEAIDDYTHVVALTPKDPGAYMLRALALKSLGRYGEAIPDFSQVLKLRPDDDDAYMERAECYRLMHRYQEALADLDRVAAILPANNNFLKEARAKIYAENGDEDRARAEMLNMEKTRQVEVHKNDSRDSGIILASIAAAALAASIFAILFFRKRLSKKNS